MTARRLTLIGASAGSGKTYRLTQEVTDALGPNAPASIDVEGLLAVTYTRRAAAELEGRIRRTLIAQNATDRAQRLSLAHIGTVHAVCLRLLQEFAIDAGLSPDVEVLSGNEASALREALERGLTRELTARTQAVAERLQIRFDNKRQRVDWLTPVQDVMTLARSNRIAPAALPAMAERASAGLLALLGAPVRDGAALDRALLAALTTARDDLRVLPCDQDNTEAVRQRIDKALSDIAQGRLRWCDWMALQKLTPGKTALSAVAPLLQVVARVDAHPRLHEDLREYVANVYEAARCGLVAYDSWKTSRRVVDFVDMVDRALTLVEHPDVAGELQRKLQLVVVDEFQDTSPLQLALFVRLQQLSQRSTWVGDRKQCIFEYAGADPALMEAVTSWVEATGGGREHLRTNYRSRPELVHACSRLFTAAFANHGYSADEVEVEAERERRDELGALPPFGIWALVAKNNDANAEAIAEGIARTLASPSGTPVVDRESKGVRPVRAGDIAVLLATNAEAERLALALGQRGIRAALAQAGLMATPEGTSVAAALSVLIDDRDALALAIIDALTGFGGQDPDAWLAGLIAKESARAAKGNTTDEPRGHGSESSRKLTALRPEISELAPTEAIDLVLGALDLARICARWPQPEQRLANIDAIRRLAAAYEDHCLQSREAATLSGLLRFFREASEPKIFRDEEIASDDQHVSGGPDAVAILTYHRAKGLEWPVVILGSLDRAERRDAFEVFPETDRASFDPGAPLDGRWIRYWPWPYGPACKKTKTGLRDRVAASPEGVATAQREERERVRLLYVGFTRARDHLVLAVRCDGGALKTRWLDELVDATGVPLLTLTNNDVARPEGELGVGGVDGRSQAVAARYWLLDPTVQTTQAPPTSLRWLAAPDELPSDPARYWLAPSRAEQEWPELPVFTVRHVETIGQRVTLGTARDSAWDVVGNAVHAFLAADVAGLSDAQRHERATRLISAAAVHGILNADALLAAGDQLRAWASANWPEALWHREIPITGRVVTAGATRGLSGVIDLLLETKNGVIVIDHKSFPGAAASWPEKALTFAPQMAAYTAALQAAGKRVLSNWVHFPLAGGVVRLG